MVGRKLQGSYSSRGEKNVFEVAFELLEHTSVLGSMLFFYLERGIYILKEALERIRLAEEQNKEAERAMIDELDHYQIEKQQALQAIQTQQKNQRKEIIQQLERELLAKENDLQNRLLAEATESQMKDEARYQQQKDQMIAQIINEMRENYGC